MAEKVNLSIDQGSNVAIQIDVADSDGDRIDLTEYTIASKIKKHFSSVNSIVFSCTGYANGTIIMELDASQTANVTPGRYYYDVEITDEANSVIRVQEGIVMMNWNIT